MTTHRVAVVQAAPKLFDLPETLDRLRARLAQAAGEGAELVIFPEGFVGGYPKGSTFGATVGERSGEGRALFARYRRSAVEIPGPGSTRSRRPWPGTGCTRCSESSNATHTRSTAPRCC